MVSAANDADLAIDEGSQVSALLGGNLGWTELRQVANDSTLITQINQAQNKYNEAQSLYQIGGIITLVGVTLLPIGYYLIDSPGSFLSRIQLAPSLQGGTVVWKGEW